MKSWLRLNLNCCLVGLVLGLNLCGAQIRQGADGNGGYASGRYQNLFAEAGHPPAQIRQKVDGALQQLFHGNLTNKTVYYATGSNSNGPVPFVSLKRSLCLMA